jgi:hypothetical protein
MFNFLIMYNLKVQEIHAKPNSNIHQLNQTSLLRKELDVHL